MMNKAIFISLGIALAAHSPLCAAINASDLLTNSPFVHAKVTPGMGTGPDSAQPYLFRGICKMGDDVLVNISDTAKKKTYWIKTGETEGDIKVVSYDDDARKVSVVIGSRDYTLELAKPKSPTPDAKGGLPGPAAQNPKPGSVKPEHRIKRVKRSMNVPPAPPSFVPNFKARANENAEAGTGNTTVNNSTHVSSGSSSDSSTDSTVTTTDTSETGTSTTPPSVIPSAPPSYVPQMPDSVKQMIESGSVPGTSNSSN